MPRGEGWIASAMMTMKIDGGGERKLSCREAMSWSASKALCSCWLLMLDLNLDRTSSDGVGCKKAQRVKTDGPESQANLAGLSIYDTIPPPGRPPQPKNMFDNTIISVGHRSQLLT
jgi:hypothetical protein